MVAIAANLPVSPGSSGPLRSVCLTTEPAERCQQVVVDRRPRRRDPRYRLPANNGDLERRLWDAADELRANSKLKASEFSVPVLGLIFLKFADNRFAAVQKELKAGAAQSQRRRRTVSKTDYLARCVYLPDNARFQTLLDLPEGENVARAINDAMKAIEDENPDLRGVLPKTHIRLSDANLIGLLRIMKSIPADIEGDAFGKI